MKKHLLASLLLTGLITQPLMAQTVNIEFQLPTISSGQYKRPYTAVWVEKAGERQAVETLAIWYEDKKWLKDVRRWWRKAGRYDSASDAVTGATKPPGTYKLEWAAEDTEGNSLSGEYLLCFEAVREHGNRTLLKQKIQLGSGAQSYQLKAGDEMGPVNIVVGE